MADPGPWTRSGLLKGMGIPSPSGERSVGCVDLIHRFEGDDRGGLLVRLFYPAQLDSTQPCNQPSTYALWLPVKKYTKAYIEFQKTWTGSGLFASITNTVLNPRMPAVLGAALLGTYLHHQSPPVNTAEAGRVNTTEHSGKGVNTEAGGSSAGVNCAKKPLFPVIVFSHGLGGMRTTYSGICCDLASHGYVVAAVEHRDQSACASLQRVPISPGSSPVQFRDEWIDFYRKPEAEKEFPLRSRQVLQRCRDAILALELLTMLNEGVDVHNMMEGNFDFKQFEGRLDISKAAIMGHSFGGATTIQALSEDQRFLCGIALDCWMLPIHRDLLETGVHQPLLFINSSDFQWPDNVRKMMKLTHPPDYVGASACTILTLKGTGHANQTDVPFVMPKFTLRWSSLSSGLDPILAHRLNLDVCHTFLKRYQLRDPAFTEQHVANLDGGEGASEHILFGSNIDVSIPSEDGPTRSTTADDAVPERDDPSVVGTQVQVDDTREGHSVVEKVTNDEALGGRKVETEGTDSSVDCEHMAKL